MANGSIEIEYSRSVIQGIASSIRVQDQYCGVPAIEITHVFEERYIFQAKSTNGKSVKNVTCKTERKETMREMSGAKTCVQCNSNEKVPCADNCLSLMLPLEVELDVLGVVDQGMIDRGEMAKIRRVGSRKRNSAPDISVETLTIKPQKSRPRSFTTSSDLVTLLNRQSLQSTTLCSTEL